MAISKRLMTVEEFEAFVELPENEDRRFELIDGEIVEKMPTEEHSLVAGKIYVPVHVFVEQHRLGRVVFETRYRVPKDTHNARVPDVAFTSKARVLPIVRQGSVPQMPDLAVEVKSPSDRETQMRRKAAYYLSNGARMVWLVFPVKRQIEVHRPDADVSILNEGDSLDGEDVLPGFTLALRDIFNLELD